METKGDKNAKGKCRARAVDPKNYSPDLISKRKKNVQSLLGTWCRFK